MSWVKSRGLIHPGMRTLNVFSTEHLRLLCFIKRQDEDTESCFPHFLSARSLFQSSLSDRGVGGRARALSLSISLHLDIADPVAIGLIWPCSRSRPSAVRVCRVLERQLLLLGHTPNQPKTGTLTEASKGEASEG